MTAASTQPDVQIQLEFTPNPDTLKYAVNRTLLPSGAANFPSREAAKGKSPLAEALFSEKAVSAVMVGTNFVTVTITDQNQLMELNETLMKSLKAFFATGAEPVFAQPKVEGAPLNEIERKIVDILEREVRPAVAMDGGDISFEKYEDGFVYLRMHGACSGCPSSLMTLKMGVETRLKDAIPEIIEVIPV